MGLFADAYPNARLRARKARLRGPDDLRVLRAAASASALATALAADPTRDAGRLPAFLLEGLLEDYAWVARDYPRAGALWQAFVGLREIENVKLAWRARTRALPASRWISLWSPLGRLETIRLSDWSGAASLREAAASARGSPYERIVAEVLQAHESDPAAAEIAFDRWAWTRLADAALALPRVEGAAAELTLGRVRERDYDLLRRAVASGRWAPDAAAAATAVLRREEPAETLRRLAAWTPVSGPLQTSLPARLARRLTSVTDWDALAGALAHQRREQCRRAFRLFPFRLAPAAAFLLLREEEVRALSALARHPGPGDAEHPALVRARAASWMER